MTVPPPNPTIRQQATKARAVAWAAQHCLTPNPDRKPKGLNVEEALRHLEEIEQLQRAILDALDAADRERTSPSNWISVYDPSPAPRPNTPDAS